MAETTDKHRPLVSGLNIHSHAIREGRHTHIGEGTLTGLATRKSDGRQMLVTALHVMSEDDALGVYKNPVGDEMMFQGGKDWSCKVSSRMFWEPISFTNDNVVDIAMCELDEGVSADFKLYESRYGNRVVVSRTKRPKRKMRVTLLGATSGEVEGTIVAVNQRITVGDGRVKFKGLMAISYESHPKYGDTGGPVLYMQKEGEYRMVGIHMAFGWHEDTRVGWAFPARTAEKKMGIAFGRRR